MSRRASCIILFWLSSAVPAAAQTCPSNYTTCDNGGCCLSSEQCCPTLEDGCCSAATPYCCGDGTCAATPSQCERAGLPECDGYDVPCGGGCAPAGSDCCDVEGHYCPPESMCTSDTTCVFGAVPTLARTVALPMTPDDSALGTTVSPPFRDPGDATDRSCALDSTTTEGSPLASVALFLAALGLRRGLRPARRGSGQCSGAAASVRAEAVSPSSSSSRSSDSGGGSPGCFTRRSGTRGRPASGAGS
jgi:hypothetical protein